MVVQCDDLLPGAFGNRDDLLALGAVSAFAFAGNVHAGEPRGRGAGSQIVQDLFGGLGHRSCGLKPGAIQRDQQSVAFGGCRTQHRLADQLGHQRQPIALVPACG